MEEECLMGVVSVCEDENILEMVVGNCCTKVKT